MNLDEAKAVIDRAWNRGGPRAIDWNEVEEASAVIAAELGAPYIPGESPKIAPSLRGTTEGYDAAVNGDEEEFDRLDFTLGASDWEAIDEMLEDRAEAASDDYTERSRRGLNLHPMWSSRARSQL